LRNQTIEIDMKNPVRLSYVLVAIAAVVFAGCKSKQPTPAGEKEVVVPCSGPDYFTNSKTFRANSIGESINQVTSKQKALTNARNELAQSIQTTVKTVTDNYTTSRSRNSREMFHPSSAAKRATTAMARALTTHLPRRACRVRYPSALR
jgi:membrane-bound lytic murein transglycosylase